MTDLQSTPFFDMATLIEQSDPIKFGGALVLVAPDGKKVQFMLTNPEPNLVAFWGFVKSCIEDAFNDYQQGTANAVGWQPQRSVR